MEKAESISKKIKIINGMMAEINGELERIASNGDYVSERTLEFFGNEIHKILIETKKY